MEQFRVALEDLEQAIGQPHASEDVETFSEDLVSRLDKLIGIANELEFATANKAKALEVTKSVSATLSELYRSAEGNPQVKELRGGVQKVKAQVDKLKQKL